MAIISYSPRDSSHIRSFSYDDHLKILSVTFAHERIKEPKVYHHEGVPLEVFNSWLRWSKDGHSAGTYYWRFVQRYKMQRPPEVLK